MSVLSLQTEPTSGSKALEEVLSQPATREQLLKHVIAVLHRWKIPHADVEGITQECLLRAWHKRGEYEAGRSAHAWLHGFVGHVVKESLRKEARYTSQDPLDLEAPLQARADAFPEVMQLQEVLDHANPPLSDYERKLLHHYYFEKRNYAEIAKLLGVKPGALRTQMSRLMTKIRNLHQTKAPEDAS